MYGAAMIHLENNPPWESVFGVSFFLMPFSRRRRTSHHRPPACPLSGWDSAGDRIGRKSRAEKRKQVTDSAGYKNKYSWGIIHGTSPKEQPI